MLSYSNRLIKRGDFEAVYRYGKPLFCDNISLRVKRNELEVTRIGISIGLKFSKKAVSRNRIKRQIREIFRKHIINIKTGFDIAVMIKKQKEEKIESKELEEKIVCALKRGKLI